MKNLNMKYLFSTLLALSMFLIAQSCSAQDRNFGLGLILGEPSGFSAKYWTSSTTAFDFALGWSDGSDRIGNYYNGYYDGGSRVSFHMDYLWHAFNAISSTERFPIYYGFGGRINSGAGYNSTLAARGVIGIAWMPHQTPVDIFVELAPTLQLTESTGMTIEGGAGIRYYF
jgi:hypothetical protein